MEEERQSAASEFIHKWMETKEMEVKKFVLRQLDSDMFRLCLFLPIKQV